MSSMRDFAWKTLETTYRSSVSYQIARYALNLNFESLPANVVHQAKRLVLDALGCGIGAYEAAGRPMVESVIKQLGGPEEATLFGSGFRTTAMNATLVNCFLVRFLDFNDTGGGGHNSDSISPILAVCEREKAHGKDLLTSVVVSYELGARIRESALFEANGWLSDTRGGLSMPCALGRLMGLNEDQIANAIGFCASHALPINILDAHYEECTMSKNLRFGFVSYHAILACLLAKKGFTGPIRVVEGECGMREVLFKNKMDIDRIVDFNGWRIMKVRHKSLPANLVTQGHIALTLQLVKEHDLKPADIASMRIAVGLREKQHVATISAKKYPRNAESADHSAYFTNAIAIKERALTPAQYSPENFVDPVVLDLIDRISVECDPKLSEDSYASTVVINTKDGRELRGHTESPHGLRDDPLTDKELEEKFRSMASKYMPESQIKKLFDTFWNLEQVDDIRKLTSLMVFPRDKQ